MATIRIPISGVNPAMKRIMRDGALVTLLLTTPEDADADLIVQLEITEPGSSLVTYDIRPVEQTKFEALLNPEGGALVASLETDIDAEYDTMEAAVIAATGAGEVAAVTAALAAGQVAIDALFP